LAEADELDVGNLDVGNLYVDLDGTLVASDTLWESLCLLLRRHPRQALRAPFWLAEGKALFKTRVADLVTPDASLLPYRPEVLAYLEDQRQTGRKLILATASDSRTARAVADHLGIFDDLLASDEETNLAGAAKLRAIEEHSKGNGFGYMGNSSADVEIWRHAADAVLVAPTREARRSVAHLGIDHTTLSVATPSTARAALKALRPHQWIKNVLLFAPIALAQDLGNSAALGAVCLAFAAFSAIASLGYLANDLLDVEADRRHPSKRSRPFASGALGVPEGIATGALLLCFGFGTSALALPGAFTGMLALYLTLTLSYTFYFKERLFIDTLMLASFYTLRVLAGGVAAQTAVSTWLLAFSVFFFLSLALVKRYSELLASAQAEPAAAATNKKLARRAYQQSDTGLVETMGITSGYVSVLVLGLYVSSESVARFYSSPDLLWLISPLMLFWISRIWFLARRGELPHDPVLFAATDRTWWGREFSALRHPRRIGLGPAPRREVRRLSTGRLGPTPGDRGERSPVEPDSARIGPQLR